ncbi:MAG: hypothetical protein IJE15_00605 [Bacteroidaceae bacterium]|nr:hypothetical protein [Bacteroidaceae bacterium]
MKKITLLAMSFVMALTVKAQRGTDVTNLLTNPDFEDAANGWTIVGGNKIAATAATYGYNGTNFIENWVAAPSTLSDQSWSQTIEVPNGIYVVRSLAHAVLQSDASVVPSGVAIYANQDMVPVTTTNTNPPTEYTVATIVTDGKLKVEYRISSCNVNWAAWDNVRLMQYVGDTEEAAKLLWMQDELDALAVSAMELIEAPMSQALKDAIQASVDAIADVTAYEGAATLLETLKAQMAEAELCIDAYARLLAELEAANAELERGFSEGLDEFYDAIDAAQAVYEAGDLSIQEAEAAILKLQEDIFTFQMLNADGTERFDVTEKFMTNPTLRKGNQGWEGSAPGLEHEVMEFYESDFDIYQTLTNIPNGMYVVEVQGFYRTTWNDSGAAYQEGTENITAQLYANNESAPMLSLYKYPASVMGVTNDQVLNDYVNMRVSTSEAFGLTNPELGIPYYAENALTVIVQDSTLKIGLRNTGHLAGSWCTFRDFKLYYYGNFPAVVLTLKIEEAQAWLAGDGATLPVTAYAELDYACLDAEAYTGVGEYEPEEVLKVLAEFEAVYNSVKNVAALVAQLKDMLLSVEELLQREYPGLDALNAAYDAATPLVEDGAEVELAEEQTTEQYYEAAIVTLQAAINAYYESQMETVTRENPADFTHLIPNANFEEKGDWTWTVVSTGNVSDQWWVGGCRPTEQDGANRQGVNLWSWGISSIDVHQDLTGLPNGLYKVSAELITQTGLATNQHVYATGIATSTSDLLEAEGWEAFEWTTLTTNDFAVVLDGKLTIGAASSEGGSGSEGWFQATNFKLYYYGEATEEDLKAAWEISLLRAQEYANILLPGDSKDVKAAIEAATPMAAEGKYAEACNTLNPAVAASDSVFNAVQKFYAGNYEALLDMTAELDYDVNVSAAKLLAVTMQMVGQALHAEDATHTILPALDAKLGGYVAYATALIEAENTLATIKGVKEEYKTFVKEQVITPQVDDLTAVLRPAADCADLQAKLEKAMKRLTSALNINLPVGDLTEDLVVNPTIDDEAATGWTVVKGTGNGPTRTGEHYDGISANRYLDSWAGSGLNFTAYQEIIGLPDGTYQLTVAARTDGDNVWAFASPEVFPADTLTADTAKWAEATQWAMVKNNGNTHGEIWYADSLAWIAADEAIEAPYFNANNGKGWGWSYDTITVEVTRHYLAIGVTANSELSRKDKFTGTWMSVDDWKLELLTKAATQSPFDVTDGIENVEAVVPVKLGIYDLFGRRIDTPTAPGIYIIDGKKTLIKK